MERTSKCIKITESVKSRLDAKKNAKTYTNYISEMLTYFEMLNLDPSAAKVHPSAEIILSMNRNQDVVLKRMEDVIKIIRNIETTKLVSISQTVESIENIISGNNTGLKTEQIQEVVNANSRLIDKKKELERENLKLKEKIIQLSENEWKEKAQDIVNIVEVSLNAKNFRRSDKGNDYYVSPSQHELLIKKIKEML